MTHVSTNASQNKQLKAGICLGIVKKQTLAWSNQVEELVTRENRQAARMTAEMLINALHEFASCGDIKIVDTATISISTPQINFGACLFYLAEANKVIIERSIHNRKARHAIDKHHTACARLTAFAWFFGVEL